MNVKCFLLEPTDRMQPTSYGFAPIYTIAGTENETTWGDAGIGAIMDADYMHDDPDSCGPDGKSYVIKTPGGSWYVDSRASNCDSPCKNCGIIYRDHDKEKNSSACDKYEDSRPHKCWVRHGEPPNLHVDKNGVTCGAGAGSIMFSDEGGKETYHGYLQEGYLTNCPEA